MRFYKEFQLEGSVDEVYAVLSDEGFRREVAHQAGATSYDASVRPRSGGGMDAVMDTESPTQGLPSAAIKVIGDTLRIHQVERWSSSTDAALEVSMPGKPGSVKGTIVLSPEGAGSRMTVDADVKVKIPLVGGTVEKVIGRAVGSVLKLQGRMANERLRQS